jgi:hypothetical protein
MKEAGYPSKEAKLKSGGMKDKSAYSEKAGQGGTVARKGAKLDSAGGVSKKNDGQYKEGCKDQ